jgi:NAD(P)-dependent dehydrogenase (short-subunit alcohol dehydrogenase family)
MSALHGARAVVTGASSGIGRAVAVRLAAEGAAVVLNGSAAGPGGPGTDRRALDAAVAEIEAAGGRAVACAGSVADWDEAGRMVATCVEAFGGIDVLVNCAGIAEPPGASILDMDPAAWRRVLDVHLTGTFHTCRHAAPHMARQGRGAIVNTASHALLGVFGGTAYPASKGGTLSLSFAIARELAPHGVRCNVICPGAATRLSTGPDYRAHIESLHARGVLDAATRAAALSPAPPELVAPLYALLASERAAGITGRVFSAAGGYVGELVGPRERPVAHRDPAAGPWPVGELADRLLARP